MKRLLSFLVVLLGFFLLSACDGFNGKSRKEIELTETELTDLLEAVAVAPELEKGKHFSLAVDLAFDYSEAVKTNGTTTDIALISAYFKGDLEIYLNLNSYDDMYVMIFGDLETKINVEGDSIDFDFQGNIEVKLSLIKGDLYLSLEGFGMGFEFSSKQKITELFLKEMFDYFVSILNSVDFADINLAEGLLILLHYMDYSDLSFYSVGKSTEISIPLESLIEEAVANLAEETDYSVVKNNIKEANATVKFSDKLEDFTAKFDVDIALKEEYGDDDYLYISQISIVGNLDLSLNLNANKPKNALKESQLAEYYETDSLKSLINNIFEEEIYEILVVIPTVDKNISDSTLGIDKAERNKLNLSEAELINLVDGVSLVLPPDNLIRAQGDVDLYFKNTYEYKSTNTYDDLFLLELKVLGNFDIYFNISSYETLYTYVVLDLDVDGYLLEEDNFLIIDGNLVIKLYLINSDIYIDIAFNNPAGSFSVQQKLNSVLSNSMFSDLLDMLAEIDLSNVDLSQELEEILADIPDEMLNVYQKGEYYDLELVFNDLFALLMESMEYNKNTENKEEYKSVDVRNTKNSALTVRFSDEVKEIGVIFYFDFEIEEVYGQEYENYYFHDQENIEMIGRVNLLIELDATAPTNLPKINDFADFYEVDENLLFLLFFSGVGSSPAPVPDSEPDNYN